MALQSIGQQRARAALAGLKKIKQDLEQKNNEKALKEAPVPPSPSGREMGEDFQNQSIALDGRANDKGFQKLIAAAESFGPLILMSGLGQAAAFYKSKGVHHRPLYDLLSEWLCGEGRPFGTGTGDCDLLERLTKADQSAYRAAQAEALAFLQWVKKFAKAYGES